MIVWVVKMRIVASQGIYSARHCLTWWFYLVVREKMVPGVHGPADQPGDRRGDQPAARGQ